MATDPKRGSLCVGIIWWKKVTDGCLSIGSKSFLQLLLGRNDGFARCCFKLEEDLFCGHARARLIVMSSSKSSWFIGAPLLRQRKTTYILIERILADNDRLCPGQGLHRYGPYSVRNYGTYRKSNDENVGKSMMKLSENL